MISSAKQKSPAQTFHPRGARTNYEILENCCRLQNDRHHRTQHQGQSHHDRHDKRSYLLGFLPISHLLYLFSRKIKPQRTNLCGSYTTSAYILHCIQFARMCNCQATNTKIFSHRACRLPFCSPLAAYRAAAAKFPGASPIPNCFVQNGNKANPFPCHSFLYSRVLFCIFLLFSLLQFYLRPCIIVTE